MSHYLLAMTLKVYTFLRLVKRNNGIKSERIVCIFIWYDFLCNS